MNELSILDALLNAACASDCTPRTQYNLPNTDVLQKDDSYEIFMELPGRDENDVELSIKDNVLTVKSVQKAENTESKAETKWLLRERKTLQFSRSFTLPKDCDCENVSAEFKNGILKITLKRKAESQARKITIQAA